MKTAGLVLDFYDDQKGETLKKLCPTVDDLPETVKEAHILSPEEHSVLRDEAYALILHNNGHQLRKFACVDEGNTVLSTIYFMENFEKLPVDAIKTAAVNLIAFNEEFGLPIPYNLKLAAETGMSVKTAKERKNEPYSKGELATLVGGSALGLGSAAMSARDLLRGDNELKIRDLGAAAPALALGGVALKRHLQGKTALPQREKSAAASGMNRKRDTMNQPMVGDEADWAGRTNLLSVRGGNDSGRVIPAANAMKTAAEKTATYTLGQLHGAATVGGAGLGAVKGAIMPGRDAQGNRKSRVKGALKGAAYGAAGANVAAAGMVGLQAGSHTPAIYRDAASGVADKFRKVGNVVDVSSLDPEVVLTKKASEKTALKGRYSIDSYSDVNDAIDYFNDTWTAMPPEDRHEFCVKTAERADELGIQIPELMSRYGSTEYAPDVNAHLANRRAVAPEFKEVWNALEEKRASVEPSTFVALLAEADESAGLNYEWGGAVADPFYATFGGRHETEKLAWAWEDGMGQQLDEAALKSIPLEKLKGNFEQDFVQAFSLNPTAIFDSMPAEHKGIIARMAQSV
jgi:hypothetical protein